MKMAKALWHISPTHSELRSIALDFKGTNGLEIAALYSLISAGTESLVAKAEVPPDLYTAMQVPYMEGSFDLPIKYAYSLVGKVLSKDHSIYPYGKTVHLMHPHQDKLVVDANHVSEVPEEVPARRACLASNLETAVNAVWDAKLSIGEKVLVLGFGLIGSLVARILKDFPGIDLWIVEQDVQRVNKAKEMGFHQVHHTIAQQDFDCAFHASTSQSGLQKCIDSVGLEGRIIELSWFGKKTVELSLGASFHYQRKKIISSQVGIIPSSHQARWNYQRRKQLVFELLKNKDYDQHLSHDIAFEDTPVLFDRLRKGDREALAWCVKY